MSRDMKLAAARHLAPSENLAPGVKINGQYYRDVLLMQGLLPDIREITEYFIFQQDSAPAHRARETVALLET